MNVQLVLAQRSSHLPRIRAAVSLIHGSQRYYRVSLRQDPTLNSSAPVNAAAFCEAWQTLFETRRWEFPMYWIQMMHLS